MPLVINIITPFTLASPFPFFHSTAPSAPLIVFLTSNYWIIKMLMVKWARLKHNYRYLSSNWVSTHAHTHAVVFYYWHAASGPAAPMCFCGLGGVDRKRICQSAGGGIWAGGSSQLWSQRSHVLMSPPEEGSQIWGGPMRCWGLCHSVLHIGSAGCYCQAAEEKRQIPHRPQLLKMESKIRLDFFHWNARTPTHWANLGACVQSSQTAQPWLKQWWNAHWEAVVI